MRMQRFLPRVVMVSAVSLALAAALGFAQPKAEKAPQGAPQQQAVQSEPGVLVVGVQDGSPAQKAGLARGDIILEADGVGVNTPFDLRRLVDSRKSGDTVSLTVRHGDAQKSLSVTLGSQSGAAWMGVQLYPGGAGREEHFGRMYGMRPFAEGALVESVVSGSPAEKAGVKQGDVILSVDGTRIGAQNSLSDLISGRKVGDTVTLSVESPAQGQPRDLTVTLEKSPDKDVPYLGVQYTMAQPRFGRGMPGPGMMAGVLVAEVAPDSPAAKAGIKPRDLITRVEGVDVSFPQQVVDAVAKHKPGDTLAVTVLPAGGGKGSDLTVTLAQNPGDASKAWMGLSLSGAPWRGWDEDRGPGGMTRQPRAGAM